MSVTVNKTRLPGSVIKTASGAVASVSDARMRGAIGVEASFSPRQDLHGYSNPWVAGGGKNLLNLYLERTQNLGVMYSLTGDGKLHAEGTNTSSTYSSFSGVNYNTYDACPWHFSAGTYTISSTGADENIGSVVLSTRTKESNTLQTFNVRTKPVSFTINDDFGAWFWISVLKEKTVNVDVGLQLETGSTATAWTPYENLCPISGITEVSAWADPQYAVLVDWNQLFPAAEEWIPQQTQTHVDVVDGVITATLQRGSPSVYAPAIMYNNPFPSVTGGHYYYFACKFKPATDGAPYIRNNTNLSGAFGSQTTPGGTWGDYKNIIRATASAELWYIGQGGNTSQIQIGDSISFKDLVCVDLTRVYGAGNEPLTVNEFRSRFPKDYYAYNPGEMMTISAVNGDPHNLTAQLGEERYGGSYDFVRGKLKLTKKYAVLNDTSLWRSRTGTVDFEYNYGFTDRKLYSDSFTGVICSFAPVVYGSGTYARWIGATQCYFGIKSTDITIAQIQNYAENGDLTICYELATPIVIDMTPAEFELFHRQNYVWSDDGNTTLTYAAIHEHGG